MPRRDWVWEEEEDDEDDAFSGPTSYMGRLGYQSAEHLGLSEEEARRHRVRPLSVGDASSGTQESLPQAGLVPRWAAERGLERALQQRAVALEPWLGWALVGAPLQRLTVEDCLRGRLTKVPQGQRAVYAGRLAQAARAYVGLAAQRARLVRARERLWEREPEAALAPLAVALRRLHEEQRAQPASEAPVFLGGAAVAVGEEPPRVVASFPEGGHALVELPLAHAADGSRALEPRCTCRAPRCGHRRVLVEALLDAVHGGTALAAEVAEVLAVPSWQRLLGALGRARRPEAARDERVAWRIGRAQGALVVQPVVQQLNPRGQWSSGRKLRPEAAARRADSAAEERAALSLFAGLQPLSHYCGAGATLARLLEALVGHPRLCALEPPHEPLRLGAARASMVVEQAGESLELAVSVAGRRVALEALERDRLDERWGLSIEGGRATLYELPAGMERLLRVLSRYGTRLPPEAHDQAAEVLSALSRQVPLELPPALRGQTVEARATFVLRLVPLGPCSLGAELLVRIAAAGVGGEGGTPLGPEQAPGEGARELLGSLGGRRVCVERDLGSEAERARALAEALALPASPVPWRWELEGEAALELVHRSRSAAVAGEGELIVEWPASEPWQTRSVGKRDLRVKLERAGQWFAIGGGVAVEGVETGLAELLSVLRAGQRFVQLGPGRFARVEAELAAAARGIDDLAHVVGGKLSVAPVAALGLESLDLPQLDAAEEWWALRARVEAAAALEPEVPSALRATLRHYQLDGFRWLGRLSAWDAGACLADDMGLGKTVQSLALLLSRPGPHLVVAPTSVGPNWLREAEVFAPSLRARLYRGPERAALLSELGPSDLIITSYDVLALDVELLAAREFDTLVLDEAQAVKNARTQRARAARALRARFRLALTGTPVENHLGDLWSILSILSPGLLGPWEHFRERFAAPIERDGDHGRLEALSALLRPFVLRRTKALVAPELPPRTTVIEPVELSRRERALYEAARQSALAELADAGRDERGRIQVLAALTRLRRLACHPALVVRGYSGPASKLETLLGLITQLREAGQRALVFSQFTSFLALVRRALAARGIASLYLDGQTPVAERSALVDAWREGRADLFLLSLKAGGSGLNLIGADAVIHLDPWWNPAVEDQATDRTHRIGQSRPVTAIRLIAQGTIEEAVLALHEGKRALADGLLAGTDAAAKLSSAELIELIRFGDAVARADAGDDASLDDEGESAAGSTRRASGSAASLATQRAGTLGWATGAPAAAPKRLSAAGSEHPPSAGSERPDAKDAGAPAFGARELSSLRARFARQLRCDGLRDGTVSTYLRCFDRLVALAEAEPAQRTLSGWYDAGVEAHQAARLAGPHNLPAILGAVLGRLERLDRRA